MSTFTGHSLAQALQDRHRSRAWRTSVERHPLGIRPCIISERTRERPRMECTSSRVALNEGHIAPERTSRQAPTPTQRWTAVAKEPLSGAKACTGVRSSSVWLGPGRTAASMGAGSVIMPGLSSPSESRIALNPAKASRISGEYMRSRSSERARPVEVLCSGWCVPPS